MRELTVNEIQYIYGGVEAGCSKTTTTTTTSNGEGSTTTTTTTTWECHIKTK